jgi:PAS domain S-box-containing protein
MMGFRSGKMDGLKIDSLFPDRFKALIEKKVEEGKKIDNFKFETITISGKKLDLSLNMDPVKNEEGDVIGHLLLLRDRTRQSRLEKRFQQTIDRYTFIFNKSTNMNIILNDKGIISDTNLKTREVLGFDFRDLRKMKFRDLVSHHDRDRFDDLIQSVRRGDYEGPEEIELISKDGDPRMICLKSGEAIPDIGLRKDEITLICEDLTEHRELENGLKKAMKDGHRLKKNIEAIANSTPLGVVIIDAPDGNVSFTNEKAKELYGTSKLNVIVKDHSKKFGLYKPDGTPFPPMELPASRALFRGEKVNDEELLIHRSDGDILHVKANAIPLLDEDGKIIQALALFWDVTDIKETRQKLDLYKEELENQNMELRKSQEELESSRNEYSDLFDYSPVGLFKLEEYGLIIDVNNTASNYLNKPRKHLLERPFQNLFRDEDRERIRQMIRNVYESGEKHQIILDMVSLNGVFGKVVLTASIVKNKYQKSPFCYMTLVPMDK